MFYDVVCCGVVCEQQPFEFELTGSHACTRQALDDKRGALANVQARTNMRR